MHREELIRFIKANDSNYSNLTFAGYSNEALFLLRRKIEEEKRLENQSRQTHPPVGAKLLLGAIILI